MKKKRPFFGLHKIGQRDLVHTAYAVRKIRMDSKALAVAHDKQGRIFERDRILLELRISSGEVL